MLARARPLLALLAFLGGAPLTAQDLQWRIPARGVVEYARRTAQFELRPQPPDKKLAVRVVPTAREGECEWRYWEFRTLAPSAEWTRPGFDDREWPVGVAGFGGSVGSDRYHRTSWKKRTICLRTAFDAPRRSTGAVLTLSHDDGIEVWLNGIRVFEADKAKSYRHQLLSREAVDALRPEGNVLAVRCTNSGGAQFVDAGLTVFRKSMPNEDAFLATMARADGDAGAIRGKLFPEVRSPALLFDGELDGKKRGPVASPKDLRDLGAWLALDLGTLRARTLKSTSSRMPALGDVEVRGTAGPGVQPGWQALRLRVRSAAPAPNGDSKRFVARHVAPKCDHSFEGELEIERHVDAEAGLVTEFRVQLRGVVAADDADHGFALDFDETCTLSRVRANRDADFRTGVNEAIVKGRDWLRKALEKPTVDPVDAKVDDRSYGSGRLALGLLALVKTGLGTEDEVVAGGFAELRKREIIDTYSLANAIMALEALYAPAGERDDLIKGLVDAPRQRQLAAADLELLRGWAETLLGNIDTRVDPDHLLRFNYVRGGRYDHSVNQYGLLGLYSAHLCGIEVPPNVWRAAANHLIRDQGDGKRRMRLRLETYAQQRARKAVAKTLTTVPISGWGYVGAKGADGDPEPMWGSMVAAGVAGLTICQAGMRDAGLLSDPVMLEADGAAGAGFAWLADHFAVRWHPGFFERTYRHHYYYLYALERACELSGVAVLHDRDWYYEGAMTLLAWQRSDGRFLPEWSAEKEVTRTAMAVLFLKKAALPVYTR